MKRIQTKFGKTLIIRLEVDDEEKDFYLRKSHANKLSDNAIKKLNADNFIFHYKDKINDVYYDYKIESMGKNIWRFYKRISW